MAWVAAAVVGGSVIGSVIQGNAAKDAANSQANAGRDAIANQTQMYNQTRADNEPYRQAGVSALDRLTGQRGDYRKRLDLQNKLKEAQDGHDHLKSLITAGNGQNLDPRWGPGAEKYAQDAAGYKSQLDALGADTPLTPEEQANQIMGFDPGFAFRKAEGEKAINAAASARGNAVSGGALKELTRYGQNFASQEYGNAYNRLAGIAGIGQQTNAQNANSGMNYANQYGQNITGIGNANAAGQIGQANAINQGIGGATNSWMQYNMMNKMFADKDKKPFVGPLE